VAALRCAAMRSLPPPIVDEPVRGALVDNASYA
jgi:hypothetical protein